MPSVVRVIRLVDVQLTDKFSHSSPTRDVVASFDLDTMEFREARNADGGPWSLSNAGHVRACIAFGEYLRGLPENKAD